MVMENHERYDNREGWLAHCAELAFEAYCMYLNSLNKEFPMLDHRWEIDEMTGKVRRLKLPELEWDDYDDAG